MSGPAPPLNIEDSAPRLDAQGAYLRLQSVSIFVRDLDRSVRFYVDQLGFNLAFDARNQPKRPWVAVAPPDGSANLTLCEPEPDSAVQAHRTGHPGRIRHRRRRGQVP